MRQRIAAFPPVDSPLSPVTFLGAGSLAQALIRGFLAAGILAPDDIRVTNRSSQERLDEVARTYDVATYRTKRTALADARTIILATKPADAPACLAQCRPILESGGLPADDAGWDAGGPLPLLISVVAGLRTAAIEALVPPGLPAVRAMPNTSCGVRESATALAVGRWAGPEHLAAARGLFEAVGLVVELDENHMNAMTALAGSGPAYVYLMLEAMTEAGVRLGLDPDLAHRLSLQTLRGAAATLVATGEAPAELRRKVTSPGGTTMAALAVLEQAGFRQGVVAAIGRAAERAGELAGAPSDGADVLGRSPARASG